MTTNFDALPRSLPETQGVSSGALLELVYALDREVEEMHSLMVLRHGQVIAEGWWSPYAPDRPHVLYSLSKSVTATAVGLAVGEGLLSLDDRVVDFFPDDGPTTPGAHLADMRVRHLLTMTTGHTEDTLGFLWRQSTANWVAAFLQQPVNEPPGTHFVYNSGATYVLSAIVQKVNGGQTLLNYLTPRLFDPLGIGGAAWDVSPQGINTGGWGLSLRTEDVAKFGQLYLQRGVWNGVRPLPEGWVEEATARQVPNGENGESDWAQGYGYQFWRCRHGAYRGDGACGQFCVVLPAQEVVCAITAGTRDMQRVLNLLWERLLPALRPAPLPADEVAAASLREALSRLALPRPQGLRCPPIAAAVSGRTYAIVEDPSGVETITLHFARQTTILEIQNRQGAHRIDCGIEGVWIEGATALETPGPPNSPGARCKVLATGAWTDARTYVAKLCFVETPFSPTITCRFAGDGILVDFQVNAAFGRTEWPQMAGRVARIGRMRDVFAESWKGVPLPPLPQSLRLALLLNDLWQDESVVALWLGGSLARGDGDAFSDIDLRIAIRPEDFDGDALPPSANRVVEAAVLSLPRKWDADITQFQLLLTDGELYDLVLQTTTRKPAPEARLVLACRDNAFAALLAEEAQDPATIFPPAEGEKVRQSLVIFWLGQQKHQKVLGRGLTLIAWKGEHMLRQTLINLWFILATGTDCGDPSRLTIHTMTPVARTIEAAYGPAAMELLAPPLRTKEEILYETARLRDEVGRVGRLLAAKLGFEYPEAVEAVALAGWAKFSFSDSEAAETP